MGKTRLEAFSDGVIAIIITIMVLELKVPHAPTFGALLDVAPVFLSYVLSFVYVGVYWNNHHHMLHLADKIGGGVLWSNLHLLFWLSLLPFTTGWMGENHFAQATLFLYGVNLLCCAIAYGILQRSIICLQGPDSTLARAIGRDIKGRISPVLYVLGVITSFISPWLSGAFYVGTACLWLVPDRRVERELARPTH
ncbi:MAG TPA: TMEM175 family protein [Burkholderiaceae bacterium]|nr:TMEM175 family protein [Burkholderiaceae bacterium]